MEIANAVQGRLFVLVPLQGIRHAERIIDLAVLVIVDKHELALGYVLDQGGSRSRPELLAIELARDLFPRANQAVVRSRVCLRRIACRRTRGCEAAQKAERHQNGYRDLP